MLAGVITLAIVLVASWAGYRLAVWQGAKAGIDVRARLGVPALPRPLKSALLAVVVAVIVTAFKPLAGLVVFVVVFVVGEVILRTARIKALRRRAREGR